MKFRNENKITQFNPFTRLQLFKIGKINKIFDKNLPLFNKISTDLYKLSSFYDSRINEENIKELNENKKNIEKFIMKKIIKCIKNKKELDIKDQKIKINKKKVLFSFDTQKKEKKNKFTLNNNSFLYSKAPSLPNLNKIYKKIIFNKKFMANSTTKKIINIKSLKKNIFNKSFNNYFYKKSDSLININKYYSNSNSLDNNITYNRTNFSFNGDNKYKSNYNLRTFITQQRVSRKSSKKKINNKENKMNFDKNLLKNLSDENLTNFINNSMSLYDEQCMIHKYNNDFIISGRQNYYKINKLLKKFDISQNIEKELDYLINEDIDTNKIYKEMKLFNKSLKGKVNTNNNDITKNVMITKTNADIINYSEYFCKMDNLYFLKNNQSFKKKYPILSKKAREEPLKKDYKKIIYHSHKNIIEGNAIDIRKLIKSCNKIMEKVNKICK